MRYFVLLLSLFSSLALAQWRVVSVTDEIEAMRFDSVAEAHSFMVSYLIAPQCSAYSRVAV